MNTRLCFLAISAVFFAGCEQRESAKTAAPFAPSSAVAVVAAPAPPPSPAFTSSDWRKAYKSSFEAKEDKTDADGITEYMACFERTSEKKCDLLFFGKLDGFKKVDYLTPAWSQINDIGDVNTFVKMYIAARDCKTPLILMAPTINQRGGWLFLRNVSFMADGNVVLEHDFEHNSVKRENERDWIHERGTWGATPNDIEGLRTLVGAKTTITRFTGESKYITLDKKRQQQFIEDARQTLEAYDQVTQSLTKAGGPTCS